MATFEEMFGLPYDDHDTGAEPNVEADPLALLSGGFPIPHPVTHGTGSDTPIESAANTADVSEVTSSANAGSHDMEEEGADDALSIFAATMEGVRESHVAEDLSFPGRAGEEAVPDTGSANAGSSGAAGPILERKSSLAADEQARHKMHVLVSNFSADQLNRYEMFRRSTLAKASVRKIIQQSAGVSVTQGVVIAMAGIAKVFVGEVVEEALDVRDKCGEGSEPLKPKHVREAVRRLKARDQFFPLPDATRRKPYRRN